MEFPQKFREIDRMKIVQAAKASLRKPEGKKALDYLINKRKLSDRIIDRFSIGYCPPSVNHCLKDRLITPIYDTYGNLVALSTRHLDENASFRFWHESFDKGFYLYGLNVAKDAIIKTQKAIVVEGEMDVACLHSYGFNMTVGLCGSAFTIFQVALLGRYCSDVFFLLDGDNSGKVSTERILKIYKNHLLGAYGLNYIPVKLPEGYDPDDFVKKEGKEALNELLANARKETEIFK